MTADRFTFYIKNPAHLYQITYTELKSLVLQYPYCQNLRYLLLKKSILENHKESDQNLHLAATYSPDRNFLYQQIKEGDSYESEADSFVLKEDYIELKDLHPEQSANPKPPLQENEPPSVVIEVQKEEEKGDSSTDQSAIFTNDQEEEKGIFPSAEEVLNIEPSNQYLEEIEEEDFIDITDEMDGIFINNQKEATPSPNQEKKEEQEQPSNKKIEDEAISIEDLIELDSLSPMKRMEKVNARKKTTKKKRTTKKEDDKEGMKKTEPDFEEIDALIEKTKKDVRLEITNKNDLELKEENESKPTPKSSFGSWLKQFQSAEENTNKIETITKKTSKNQQPKTDKAPKLVEEPEVKKKKRKKKKKKKGKKLDKKASSKSDVKPEKAKAIAQKSLELSSEIASETLAFLLVKQKKYEQAIKMYGRLSLIFPEKSSFFAEQIKKIKNL